MMMLDADGMTMGLGTTRMEGQTKQGDSAGGSSVPGGGEGELRAWTRRSEAGEERKAPGSVPSPGSGARTPVAREHCGEESSSPSVGAGERIRVRGAQEGPRRMGSGVVGIRLTRTTSAVVGLARGVEARWRRLPRGARGRRGREGGHVGGDRRRGGAGGGGRGRHEGESEGEAEGGGSASCAAVARGAAAVRHRRSTGAAGPGRSWKFLELLICCRCCGIGRAGKTDDVAE